MSNSLFKYLPERYIDEYVEEGKILFRPLSYFISEYQETNMINTRKDPNEAKLQYDMKNVEKLNVNGKNVPFVPNTVMASEEYKYPYCLFIHCLSESLSNNLYLDFECDNCIEIKNKEEFIERLTSQIHFSKLKHNRVKYENYIIEKERENIFYKTEEYINQKEFRLYFSIDNLDNEKDYHFSFICEPDILMCSRYTEIIPKIGNISNFVKIHRKK